jgi:anti-sigma factor RsiW
MNDCSAMAGRLDAWLDGELDPAEAAEVADHVTTCTNCRAEADAIRSILTEARALPRSLPPARELWAGIEQRVGGTRPDGGQHPADFGLRSLRSPWTRLAAAILLMLLGATLGMLWERRSAPADVASAQARYAAVSAALASRLAADPGTLTPGTRMVVERNLAIIDQAIGEAETALAADPGNTALEQMLVARYAQRLALLHHAIDAGRGES